MFEWVRFALAADSFVLIQSPISPQALIGRLLYRGGAYRGATGCLRVSVPEMWFAGKHTLVYSRWRATEALREGSFV